MFSISEMLSMATKLFSAFASITAFMVLARSRANDLIPHPIRSRANELIPKPVRSYFISIYHYLFSHLWEFTLVIDRNLEMASVNLIYDAAEVYLGTIIRKQVEEAPNKSYLGNLSGLEYSTKRLRVGKTPRQDHLTFPMENDQEIVDLYGEDNIQLKWKFVREMPKTHHHDVKQFFELSFDSKFINQVLNSYLTHVMESTKKEEKEKTVKLYTRHGGLRTVEGGNRVGGGGGWGCVQFKHPATFDTLAMNPELKDAIKNDLDRFLRREEYYKRVGKAWKRGYLLYGPPGTGKSSLVAAMANYLKFDIYDLELQSLDPNCEPKKILLSTTNRSILVIEDIDCNSEMQDRRIDKNGLEPSNNQYLTLSGLLNFIDGLWSSCGDERIIVFTTNYKDRIDPALLRPGRMDMHINMSYCTPQGFRHLAFNYLGISDDHPLFGEIEGLIENTEITPAEIAEELMRSEDAGDALEGLIKFIKQKKIEGNEIKDERAN